MKFFSNEYIDRAIQRGWALLAEKLTSEELLAVPNGEEYDAYYLHCPELSSEEKRWVEQLAVELEGAQEEKPYLYQVDKLAMIIAGIKHWRDVDDPKIRPELLKLTNGLVWRLRERLIYIARSRINSSSAAYFGDLERYLPFYVGLSTDDELIRASEVLHWTLEVAKKIESGEIQLPRKYAKTNNWSI